MECCLHYGILCTRIGILRCMMRREIVFWVSTYWFLPLDPNILCLFYHFIHFWPILLSKRPSALTTNFSIRILSILWNLNPQLLKIDPLLTLLKKCCAHYGILWTHIRKVGRWVIGSYYSPHVLVMGRVVTTLTLCFRSLTLF